MYTSKNKITVYWTYMSLPSRISRTNLLFDIPRPLLSTLPKDGQDSSRRCYATQDFFKNTFVITHPLNFDVTIHGTYPNMGVMPDNGILLPRASIYENTVSVTYDYGWLFFCEESIKIAQYPPFMHNTETSKHASMPAGSYDISKWFRPILPTYTLWEGNNTFKAKVGEPMMYVNFETDKKVKLQQFELTEEIFNLSQACENFKEVKPFTPLDELYKRFTVGKRDKRLLRLIKENIL
jgi:hypothetical protein